MKLWHFGPAQHAVEYMYRLYDAKPRMFEIINGQEITDYLYSLPRPIDSDGTLHPDRIGAGAGFMPIPRLRIATTDFRMNFIYMGLYFLSAQLIHALDLEDHVVRYSEVDCSACAPEVQAMGYRVMHPLVFANPLDQSFASGVFEDVILPDGRLTQYWRTEPPRAGPPVGLLTRWRDDFVAPAPMFQILGGPWTLVTDALAERVMRAGFDDVIFIDVTYDGTRSHSIHRTLSD